jgi:hypothetical protein
MVLNVFNFIIVNRLFAMSAKMDTSIDLTIELCHFLRLLRLYFLRINCDIKQFGKDSHFMLDLVKICFDNFIVPLNLFCLG